MQECLRRATEMGYLDGQLFETDDLIDLWDQVAPEYMADAVPNVPNYPLVAIAWAGYLGMAYAYYWDKDWNTLREVPHPYQYVAHVRGFDMMDEYVLNELLCIGYESVEGQKLENTMRVLAELAHVRIRKEQVEPQSEAAFHIFARTVKTMYRLGVAIELHRQGYKYEKIS